MNFDTIDIDEKLLSPLTRIFAQAIGLPQTLALIKARGGTQIRIPVEPELSSELSKIITRESIAKLSARYGGQRFDLPKDDRATRQIRDMAIRKGFKTKTAPMLALEYGLSRKQIFNICKDVKRESPNLELFPLDTASK